MWIANQRGHWPRPHSSKALMMSVGRVQKGHSQGGLGIAPRGSTVLSPWGLGLPSFCFSGTERGPGLADPR